MKYGRTDGKKIILHADIAGNVYQDQLWAILDTVDSDFEEDINDLIADSDTEFETITYDATTLINNVEEAKSSKMPLLTENALEAVVHTDPPTSSVHHQTASNDQPGPSKSIATEGTDGEESIDFSLTSMRSVKSGTKSRRVTREPSGDAIHVSTEKDGNSPVSTEMQIEEPLSCRIKLEGQRITVKLRKKLMHQEILSMLIR